MNRERTCTRLPLKMSVVNIMLDLETLSLASDAAIIRIGAIAFDFDTEEIALNSNSAAYPQFDILIDPVSCSKAGLAMDGDTFRWWFDQENVNDFFIDLFQNGADIKVALERFTEWIEQVSGGSSEVNINLWGNGIINDNIWIESAFKKCNLPIPWKYWCHRDVRTLLDLTVQLTGVDFKKDTPFVGEKHNPIDDCLDQIKYCKKAYNLLNHLINENVGVNVTATEK